MKRIELLGLVWMKLFESVTVVRSFKEATDRMIVEFVGIGGTLMMGEHESGTEEIVARRSLVEFDPCWTGVAGVIGIADSIVDGDGDVVFWGKIVVADYREKNQNKSKNWFVWRWSRSTTMKLLWPESGMIIEISIEDDWFNSCCIRSSSKRENHSTRKIDLPMSF